MINEAKREHKKRSNRDLLCVINHERFLFLPDGCDF